MIFHHTDYESHDPEKNPFYHSYLCKRLEEGTRITVSFNEKSGYSRAPVSGILRYKTWIDNDLFPFLEDDNGTWEPIIPYYIVELN